MGSESGVVRDNRIVAVALLTKEEVDRLGTTFTRLWPVEETPCFDDLLKAIDEADRASGAKPAARR